MAIKKTYCSLIVVAVIFFTGFNTGCGVYKLRDVSVDPAIRSFHMRIIENRASYINPRLSPSLTEGVRRRIINQTKLSQATSENAHLDISGEIRGYDVTTSGVANQQSVINRLTVSVHIVVRNSLSNAAPKEIDVSRGFEFDARLSQQTAEAQLLDEMIRSLSDDIFNRLFSTW
jgi:outer membrane lipopolysaccharide assembly protein LptE/RlpB